MDYDGSYSFVRDFVGHIHKTGCKVFIVHARNAELKGLFSKDNSDIFPLRYERVHELKRDFPDAIIVLNSGLADAQQAGKEFD